MVKRIESLPPDLLWTHRILARVLEEEAAQVPEAGAVLRSLSEQPGKFLRPRLVLSAARFVLGRAAPLEVDLSPAVNELEHLRDSLSSRPQGILSRGAPELEDWSRTTSFSGGLENRFYLLAAAVEMLHLATLTHDDVIDESPIRRGLPSARARLGNQGAVLLGDLLLTLCFSLVNEAGSREVARLLSGLVRLMARAEFLQLGQRRHLAQALHQPKRKTCLRIMAGKTALLFGLALVSGAQEAGGTRNLVDELGKLGFCLGMAFQIADDLNDLLADPELSGKPRGQDLAEGQLTLPVMEALHRSRGNQHKEFVQLIESYTQGKQEVFQTIVNRVEGLGGFRAALGTAQTYLERSRRHLDRAREMLETKHDAAGLSLIVDLVEGLFHDRP